MLLPSATVEAGRWKQQVWLSQVSGFTPPEARTSRPAAPMTRCSAVSSICLCQGPSAAWNGVEPAQRRDAEPRAAPYACLRRSRSRRRRCSVCLEGAARLRPVRVLGALLVIVQRGSERTEARGAAGFGLRRMQRRPPTVRCVGIRQGEGMMSAGSSAGRASGGQQVGACSEQARLRFDAADGSQQGLLAIAIGQPGIEVWTKCRGAFHREHRLDAEACLLEFVPEFPGMVEVGRGEPFRGRRVRGFGAGRRARRAPRSVRSADRSGIPVRARRTWTQSARSPPPPAPRRGVAPGAPPPGPPRGPPAR
jgi:hypothetical protein